MQYAKFIALAQSLKAGQASNEVKFLDLLVDQEADVINWKTKENYTSWAELLREEGLCTYTTYVSYKKAKEILPSSWIAKLGVYATISLSKLDADQRGKVFDQVKKWYAAHQVAPTYQRVSTYVKNIGGSRRKAKAASKLQKMKTYITKCQGLLKQHKIPVPEVTWS
jgi:hypothetical protein